MLMMKVWYAQIIFSTKMVYMGKNYSKNCIDLHLEWSDLMEKWERNIGAKSMILAHLSQNFEKTGICWALFSRMEAQITSFEMQIYTVFQVVFIHIYHFCWKIYLNISDFGQKHKKTRYLYNFQIRQLLIILIFASDLAL